MSSTEVGPSNNSNGNGLLLYHHYASYYSQKVVMALNEKRLNYKSQMVQLLKHEQYEPAFMRLNPKGQVPVLIDGVKMIPDSLRIIDYLEDNFSNGDTPRLCPEKGTESAALVQQLRGLLYSVPIEIITFGCLRYPELTKDMEMPRPWQKLMTDSIKKRPEVLENLAAKYPEFAEHYLNKRDGMSKINIAIQNIEEVVKALGVLEVVLDDIERRLQSNVAEKVNWWLCCDKFTVADISLAVLLKRLKTLGLWNKYFEEGQRPHLLMYFQRVQEKPSFSVTFQSKQRLVTVCAALRETAPVFINISVVLAAVIIGTIIYKAWK